MDLTTQQDKILLKNCILVKIRQLELELEKSKSKSTLLDTSDIENEISLYENLFQLLKADDTEGLLATLNHYKSTDSIRQFSIMALSNESSKKFAKRYIDLTESLMREYDVYTDDDFESLKKAFYQGTNIRYDKTTDSNDLEEEPSDDSANLHLSPEEEEILSQLSDLLKHAKTTDLTPTQFKEFSAQFRDLTKLLGIDEFQHSFEDEGKKVVDMDISFDTTTYQKPVYLTDFEILDKNGNQYSISVNEPASNSGFSATYYQNLCYTYLEADEFAKIDEKLIDTSIIESKIATFDECYRKLEEMMLKCDMKIRGKKIFYIAHSSYEPSNDITIPDPEQQSKVEKGEEISL